jgi:hypothetical protein
LRDAAELAELRDRRGSPANQLLAMVEAAAARGGLEGPAETGARKRKTDEPARKMIAKLLLGWSCLVLSGSIGYLAYETLKPAPVQATELPGLDFSGVTSRYVQSSEGPAVELSGIVRNVGQTTLEPEVTIQLAGNRVAVEQQLRLGGAALPPSAERPFTVRALLPEGTRTVRLLSAENQALGPKGMALVSPAWTAPGL